MKPPSMMLLKQTRRLVQASLLGGLLLAWIPAPVSAQVTDPEDAWAREDILRLDASVSGGVLTVQVTTRGPLDDFTFHFIDIFLDTDQNGLTGNALPGGVGGVEYRIECLTGVLTSFHLHRFPDVDGSSAQTMDFADIPGASGTVRGGVLTLRLPVAALGGAGAVDVFALAHEGNNPTFIRGNGDRCPDAGALSTSTGTVVVRRPAASVDVTFDDPAGDHPGAGDLTAVRFRTFGDQFQIILTFAAPPDPTSLLADLWVGVTLDSDRSLLTGFRSMGTAIPTWGGDVELLFSMSSGAAYSAQLLLGVMQGSSVPFGVPYSDGRWHFEGNRLVLTASQSVFDARFLLASGVVERGSQGTVERRLTDGRMIAAVSAGELAAAASDHVPEDSRALDLGSGQVLEPFQWNPAQTVSRADPQEFGPVSGIDLVQVDAAVIEAHLVVKGVLTRWDATAIENGFWVLLDTDARAATGRAFSHPQEPGQPPIGVDYAVSVYSRDEFTYVGYYADLVRPDGKVEPHDAWLEARPSSQGPASFTVTLPLERLGRPGPEVRLLLVTANDFVAYTTAQLYDVAPPAPLVISTGAGTAPAAPALVSPADGATGVSLTPTLTWSASTGSMSYGTPGPLAGAAGVKVLRVLPRSVASRQTGAVNTARASAQATSYQVQVSTAADFSSTVADQSGLSGTSYTPPAALQQATTYYWRVRAYSDSGTSAWSAAWHFTTGAAGEAVPLRHFDPEGESVNWTVDAAPPIDSGYVFGTNLFQDRAKATAFSLPGDADEASLTEVRLWFGHVTEGLTTASYTIEIYGGDPASGPMASPLYSQSYRLADAVAGGSAGVEPTLHVLGEPVRVGRSFFVAVDFGTYDASGYQNAAIAATDYTGGRVAEVWERWQDGRWFNVSDAWLGEYGDDGLPVAGTGEDGWHLWVEATVTVSTNVSSEAEEGLPSAIGLHQNYPNPFNPTTTIAYSLPAAQQVKVQVFDMMGREITTLVDRMQPAGTHQVTFEAHGLSSGVFVYRIQAGGVSVTRTMLLLK